MEATTAQVVAVIFLATVIRSAFGFGEAMVAVPLLALFIPLKAAAPLAVMVSITVAAIVVAQDWRKVHIRSAGWLVGSSLAGIPIGLSLLAGSHQQAVKTALAVLILLFSGYSLLGRRPPELHSDSRLWLVGCGFCAGVLGGAYGMNGPPLVVYGAMRRWSAQHFRATLQAYFLPASILGLAGFWIAGLWTPPVTRYYLLCLPIVFLAVWLGRIINSRLRGVSFLRYVHVGLIVTATLLLVQSLRLKPH
jgi:uncharacterized membrane protein YfcA